MRPASLLLAAALALVATGAAAHDFSVGTVHIGNPWLRATPRGANVAAGYMTLTNRGAEPDRLIGGTVAGVRRFEIHSMIIEDGVAKMRPMEKLELPPGAAVELKPGSLHLMLLGLTQALHERQRVKGTLVFERAGPVEIEYMVQPIGQTTAPPPSGNHAGH